MSNPAAPKVPRTIVVAITALDAGIVVVNSTEGAPRVLQGADAAKLHELALDESIPASTLEQANAGGFAGRLLSLAERFVSDGG